MEYNTNIAPKAETEKCATRVSLVSSSMCCRLILLEDNNISFILSTRNEKPLLISIGGLPCEWPFQKGSSWQIDPLVLLLYVGCEMIFHQIFFSDWKLKTCNRCIDMFPANIVQMMLVDSDYTPYNFGWSCLST